jgi:hypothetical protein
MIENARLTPGPGFSPLKSALYHGMRLLPFAVARKGVAAGLAWTVNLMHPSSRVDNVSPEVSEHIDSVAASLKRDGCVVLRPLLKSAQIVEILAFLEGKRVTGNGCTFPTSQVPAGVFRAGYSLSDLLTCPHILPLINNTEMLGIAEAYLGCRPTISGIGLHWSFPTDGQEVDVQCFHRDPDDWRFLKLFVYLTDVDEQSGPHEFVTGSHRSSGRVFSKPYSDEDVERLSGKDKTWKIIGSSGTTFIADTWGIHKGHVPLTSRRLLLQVQYSILPVIKFEYRAVKVPGAEHLDRYTNRLLVA